MFMTQISTCTVIQIFEHLKLVIC